MSKELLHSLAWEAAGLVLLIAGIADRVTTPTPPFEATSYNPAYTVAYNVDYRFRSSMLIAAGVSMTLAGLPSLIYTAHKGIK